MKNKQRTKNKILISLVAFLTALMCTSVGFATWLTTGERVFGINGNLDADDYVPDMTEVSCFSDLSLTSVFSFSQYGFLKSDNSFSKSSSTQVDIVGGATFVPEPAYSDNLISSLSDVQSNSKFKMTITIYGTYSLASILIGNSATVSWGGSSATGTISTTSTSENISAYFLITNVSVVENTIFTFTFKVSSPNFDSFYTNFNGSGKGFMVSIKAEEASN